MHSRSHGVCFTTQRGSWGFKGALQGCSNEGCDTPHERAAQATQRLCTSSWRTCGCVNLYSGGVSAQNDTIKQPKRHNNTGSLQRSLPAPISLCCIATVCLLLCCVSPPFGSSNILSMLRGPRVVRMMSDTACMEVQQLQETITRYLFYSLAACCLACCC